MGRRNKLKAAMRFMALMVLDPPPKRRRPGSEAEAQMSFGGDIFKDTEIGTAVQDAHRKSIAAALPGQLPRRAKDAAAHRAMNVREAKRMASTFVAEAKWRRDWSLWR